MRRVVQSTAELKRILALPKREPHTDARILDKHLARLPGHHLRPIQAQALDDMITTPQGALIGIGVGEGKTLISLLAPIMLDSKRPLLIVPAALREKTHREAVHLGKAWHIASPHVISYAALGLAKNAELLDQIAPDLIVMDEAHRFKNRRAARTRRLLRYLRAHPDVRVVAMSGTLFTRSLRDVGHLAEIALREGSPLPRATSDLNDWADALDPGVPDESRLGLGALRALGPLSERLRVTPGVTMSTTQSLDVSLAVMDAGYRCTDDMLKNISRLAASWTSPDGWEYETAVDIWRHARELALGFWYRWKFPAPQDWLDARADWARFVRETLAHSRKLDSPLQVWQANPEHPARIAWEKVKGDFKPITEPVFFDDAALRFAAHWAQKPGIVWVEHVAFGQALADMTGLPYYGAGTEPPTRGGSMICSIAAHGEGKNLQHWNRNLITCPPSSAKTWEQLLGRTHRPGQLADEVSTDVMIGADPIRNGLEKPIREARFLESASGNAQKILYCDWDLNDREEIK